MGKKRNNRRLVRDNERAVRSSTLLKDLVAGLAVEEQALRREVGRRKRLERKLWASNEELREANDKLAEVNGELDSFAYALSHDLRAPLRHCSSLLGFIEEDQDPPLNDEAKEHLRMAVETTERMSAMISGVLDYARARDRLVGAGISLDDVLDEAQRNLEYDLKEAGAEVVMGQLPDIVGHRYRMIQLFQNLLENAIRYRSERPLRVDISAEPKDDGWLVSITDNGIGMTERATKQVFGLFRRMHSNAESMGIGLSVCRQVAMAHGGTLDVRSEVDVGSTFLLWLPKQSPAAAMAKSVMEDSDVAAEQEALDEL